MSRPHVTTSSDIDEPDHVTGQGEPLVADPEQVWNGTGDAEIDDTLAHFCDIRVGQHRVATLELTELATLVSAADSAHQRLQARLSADHE